MLYRSGKSGSPCDFVTNGNDECEFGLFCDPVRKSCQNYLPVSTVHCPGAPRNCSIVEREDCICGSKPNESSQCKKLWDPLSCNYNQVRSEYRDCMLKNNCPYETQFIYSWMIHSLTSDTCMGKSCGDIAKKFLCCALPSMKDDRQSWSDITPLQCPTQGTGTYILIIFLSCFLIFVFLLFIVSSIYFLLKWKKVNGFSSTEEIY